MHIVLLEPEIPSNTGNIARTCVCTGTTLHLIRPLGFSLNEKQLKRAGMDYWDQLDLFVYDCYDDFVSAFTSNYPDARIFYATTKGKQTYADVTYGPDDFIMFGKESAGIPEDILRYHRKDCVRIPMGEKLRSLNLANSAAIVLYEALRQQGFPGLLTEGELRSGDYVS